MAQERVIALAAGQALRRAELGVLGGAVVEPVLARADAPDGLAVLSCEGVVQRDRRACGQRAKAVSANRQPSTRPSSVRPGANGASHSTLRLVWNSGTPMGAAPLSARFGRMPLAMNQSNVPPPMSSTRVLNARGCAALPGR